MNALPKCNVSQRSLLRLVDTHANEVLNARLEWRIGFDLFESRRSAHERALAKWIGSPTKARTWDLRIVDFRGAYLVYKPDLTRQSPPKLVFFVTHAAHTRQRPVRMVNIAINERYGAELQTLIKDPKPA